MNIKYSFCAAVVIFIWSAPNVSACTCVEYETPTNAQYWRAKFVVVAKVKSIETKATKYELPSGAAGGSTISDKFAVAHLQIEEVLRGDIGGEILSLVSQGPDCLVEYRKGKKYLIFGSAHIKSTGMIDTSICDGSVRLGKNDSKYLDSIRLFGKQDAVSIFGRVFNHNEPPMAAFPGTGQKVLKTSATVS